MRTEKVVRWLDAGTPEALIETNAYLLEHRRAPHNEIALRQSNVLLHPVFIHESSHVENSVIGPNVSIGENCSIQGSIIKHTIIDDDSTLTAVSLANSLIGRGCSVCGQPEQILVADRDGKKISCSIDDLDG